MSLVQVAQGCLFMAALVFVWPAAAQSTAGNKAAAEALFEEGRTLMQKHQYGEACSKLEASQNLDAGLGTLMLLSDCYEKTGRTASAWATFREAAAVARMQGDEEREKVARARADALEPNLAKLVIRGPESTMQIEGLQVKMNGQAVAKAQWGTLIPVDPGEVDFEVSAPGYKSWQLTAQVVQGPSETAIDIPELQRMEQAADTPTETTTALQDGGSGSAEASLSMDSGSTGSDDAFKTVGLALGIAGVVGAGVGAYFGLRAKSKNDKSEDHCISKNQCFAEGVDLRDDAKSAATASTIAFGLGGALLVAGGVLYFTSSDSETAEARPALRWTSSLSPVGGQLGLEGSW